MLTEITDEMVGELGREALTHGDVDMADMCRDALDGCEDAWCECARIIREGQWRTPS